MRDAGIAEVITLGRVRPRPTVGALEPVWSQNFMTPGRPSTPVQPQNLMRPTLQTLGNIVMEDVSLGNLGKVLGLLGQGESVVNGEPAVPPTDTLSLPPEVSSAIMTSAAQAQSFWSQPAVVYTRYTVSTLSAAASAYHGYRRNGSLGWGLWWALMGGLFPLITPAIGLAQGWGKRQR